MVFRFKLKQTKHKRKHKPRKTKRAKAGAGLAISMSDIVKQAKTDARNETKEQIDKLINENKELSSMVNAYKKMTYDMNEADKKKLFYDTANKVYSLES